MTNLSNKYNVQIICIYGAASHGKGLIHAMSSFGVKVIQDEILQVMISGSKVVMIFANSYHLDVTVGWVTQISI